MISKRLEREEERQAERVGNAEELDATRENNATESGVNGVARRNESVETADVDPFDVDLEDEEEEQAEDAMTGGV